MTFFSTIINHSSYLGFSKTIDYTCISIYIRIEKAWRTSIPMIARSLNDAFGLCFLYNKSHHEPSFNIPHRYLFTHIITGNNIYNYVYIYVYKTDKEPTREAVTCRTGQTGSSRAYMLV